MKELLFLNKNAIKICKANFKTLNSITEIFLKH